MRVLLLHYVYTWKKTERTMFKVLFTFGEITGYQLKCPDTAQWNLYGKGFCNVKKPSYVCLFDENNDHMIEKCEHQPNFQTPGYKYVIRGGYDGKQCDHNTYQPFKFWTNGSSDCIFSKSKCDDEGQVYASYGSTTTDVTCRCDSSKGYVFVHEPLHNDHCQPTIEDCSCFFKPFDRNIILPPGYKCSFGETHELDKSSITHRNRTTNKKAEISGITMKRTNESYKAFLAVMIMTILMSGISVIVYILGDTIEGTNSAKKEDDVSLEFHKDQLLVTENKIQHDLLETLIKGTIVTVVGPSESLQAVDHVISEISKNQGYQIIHCSCNLDEIEIYVANRIRQVICINITKNDTITTTMSGRWKKFVSSMYQQPTVKLLFTSELPVFQIQLFQEIDFLTETIFDFKSNQMMTENGDRMRFNARLFLTDHELDSIKQYRCANQEELFQVLCKRYAQKKVAGKVEPAKLFFKDYEKTIREDICEEMNKEDKSALIALLLLVINNNCVPNDMIYSDKLTTQLRNIAEMLDIGKPISHNDLTNCYAFLAKSYIEKSGSNYRIVSNQIYGMLVSFFGENILPIAIKLPRKEIITDR